MSFRNQLACALLITGLAACGGGGNQSSGSAEPSSSAGAMMSTSGAMNAASIESRPQAPIPSSLNCGAVKPVWTNPHSHTYFESTAPFYGRTKSGSYMCPSAAVTAGYHKASGKRHHGAASMEGGMPSPAST